MNVRYRLAKMEGCLPDPSRDRVVLSQSGQDDEAFTRRLADAKRRGNPITIVRLAVQDFALTREDAERLLAEHRAAFPDAPVTIYDRACPQEKRTLASWSPAG